MIDYHESGLLFKNINENATIVTDAQFAKWLKDNFGLGQYYVQAWKMGREGFWAFIKLECREDDFIRLPRKKTQIQNEITEKIKDYRKLNKTLKEQGLYEDEKSNISEEIDNLKEELDLDKEIAELEKNRYGPAPYLKSCMPIYFPHEYEDYTVYNPPQKIARKVVSIKKIQEETKKEVEELNKEPEIPVNTLW